MVEWDTCYGLKKNRGTKRCRKKGTGILDKTSVMGK